MPGKPLFDPTERHPHGVSHQLRRLAPAPALTAMASSHPRPWTKRRAMRAQRHPPQDVRTVKTPEAAPAPDGG